MQSWMDAVALLVLAGQWPIPLFWLFVHPFKDFWVRHPRRAYYVIGPVVWGGVTVALVKFHDRLLVERLPYPVGFWLLGAALLLVDLKLLRRVERDLGWRALVGLPELQPGRHVGRLAQNGIYALVRHPRYLGMMLAYVAAGCLTRAPWVFVVAAVGCVLGFGISELEERELLSRLGDEYARYRQRVPRFIPHWPASSSRR